MPDSGKFSVGQVNFFSPVVCGQVENMRKTLKQKKIFFSKQIFDANGNGKSETLNHLAATNVKRTMTRNMTKTFFFQRGVLERIPVVECRRS